MSTSNSITEAFSLYAEEYDRWFDEPKGRMLFELEVKAIRMLMNNLCPPFLEIGVGSGRFATALGIHYDIEPSEALLELTQERGIKAERAFGEKLPFPNDIFGAVFILFTLCFVKDTARVLSEAKRVLKKGGGLILGIINGESPWGKLYKTKATEGHPLYKHARLYSVKEAVELIEEAGLKIEAFSSILCQPPADMPHEESANDRLVEDAGFVCIRARKADTRGGNER